MELLMVLLFVIIAIISLSMSIIERINKIYDLIKCKNLMISVLSEKRG